MIKRKLTLTISLLLLTLSSFAQINYAPKSTGDVINHSYYSLSYVESAEQSEWVYYKLTPEMVNGAAARSDDFREDKKISSGSAQLIDYRKSGNDRGHLCPAASMKLNKMSMSESFLMSNMSPQKPSFNRGGWKKLEELVRSWVLTDSLLYVATGPVLSDDMDVIGTNKVAVPKQFYKIIYAPNHSKMIAFLMPNDKIINELSYYTRSVDDVEEITNIDFFHSLPIEEQEKLESSFDLSLWSF